MIGILPWRISANDSPIRYYPPTCAPVQRDIPRHQQCPAVIPSSNRSKKSITESHHYSAGYEFFECIYQWLQDSTVTPGLKLTRELKHHYTDLRKSYRQQILIGSDNTFRGYLSVQSLGIRHGHP